MLKIALLLILAIGASLVFFSQQAPKMDSSSAALQHNLPWQIERQGGNSRVFGITLGISTLTEAIAAIDREYELAILAKYQQAGALELYYHHFNAGQLQGKLILVADIDDSDLVAMKAAAASHKTLDNGTQKYTLSQQQQQAIQQRRIRSITFAPIARLDQSMIEQRFGQAEQQIDSGEHISHYLYPQLGLDILIDKKGKDLLQYVAPSQFTILQQNVLQQGEEYNKTL